MNDRLNTESDMYPWSSIAHASTRCHLLLASRILKFLKYNLYHSFTYILTLFYDEWCCAL